MPIPNEVWPAAALSAQVSYQELVRGLKDRGLPASGRKEQLVARLAASMAEEIQG